jgi:succinate dehydrogenase/fumarate reductase flavoprotein subunit
MVESDVLVVGGGIAGLMAAIRSAELGVKVVVAEKANTLRSGDGSTGNDHFRCYIPEVHDNDIKPVIEETLRSQIGARPRSFVETWIARAFDVVKLWDSWGIPMKHGGKWEFAGHGLPGGWLAALKYCGQNQKIVLTREAKKRGVEIVNRVTVFDLLKDDNGVVGAIGSANREDKMVVFQAKAVFLGTGGLVRLYPGITPAMMFNRATSPCTTGDGRAMAYRAGAELVNVEFPQRWAGPKYFSRCGKGTWIGVVRDPQDKPVGPFVNRPDRLHGDVIADLYNTLFEDYERAGKGPVYMDCRGLSDDDFEYMMWGLTNEGNTALINYMQQEGIDVRKKAVEFMTYEMTSRGGISYNERGETSLKGLYAAGDEYFGGISAASTIGWLAGESVAQYVKDVSGPPDAGVFKEAIGQKKELLSSIMGRQGGHTWQEANLAVEHIMQDYAGRLRSEATLQAGLAHLRRLRKKVDATLMAKNQHELMHCLETLNLMEIGEVILLASLERKESRKNYNRSDYAFTNPLLDEKQITCKKVKDKPVLEWKEVVK